MPARRQDCQGGLGGFRVYRGLGFRGLGDAWEMGNRSFVVGQN